MNILVVGGGAREHALCKKLKQSAKTEKLLQIPYSKAISEIADSREISSLDFEKIGSLCSDEKIDLAVIGPEEPLSKGIADFLEKKGVKVFGPKLRGAVLESSKQVAKEFMNRHYIPTADFKIIYDSSYAKEYLKEKNKYPVVIKADGLAAGKGVRICFNEEEAFSAVEDFMEKRIFGSSGSKIIIEEFLEGTECSVMAIVDGKTFAMLPVSMDHKRLRDGDEGPNTGGMGAVAPVKLSAEMTDEIKNEILWRFITGIVTEKIDYRGVIYAGLMITKNGPKVLEFNCRFGDPETQVLLELIDEDMGEIFMSAACGSLIKEELNIKNMYSACIVLSAQGYPENPRKGDEISGLEKCSVSVFHAGTKFENGKYFTNGGRVLSVCALGKDLKEALDKAYKGAEEINFSGKHFRKDIGAKLEKIKAD
ncbi:MAG: phosphoribosylamine--glycine ligase [Elusimicrobia bacterium]|nr:phosphoribosylamine--glycine ligase [Elusimicrobiota bacterium]